MTTDQKALLQHAAALSGRTLSEFVLASAQDAAAKSSGAQTIRCRERAGRLVTALLKPAGQCPPAQAAEKYRSRWDCDCRSRSRRTASSRSPRSTTAAICLR